MDRRTRIRNRRMLVAALALTVPTTLLVVWSPTLYTMFCNLTGIGGTVQRAVQPAAPSAEQADRKITVFFDANVAPGLDWEFRPAQHKVEVAIGEPTRVYYTARNRSNRTEVAQATFNIVPFKAGPYFYKIECFCFTREKLAAGESARMPLVFYVDEQMLKDNDLGEVHQMTLSYTMFAQHDLSPQEIDAARDLAAGSQALDKRLDKADKVEFENDAPRR